MESYKTEQESFWAGAFGDEYRQRNQGEQWVASNTALFARILSRTEGVTSAIEFGANIGLNLLALRHLRPGIHLSAVEINQGAADKLRALGEIEVFAQSILAFSPQRSWDVALTKGVLIHLNPDVLPEAYDRLHSASSRYICIAEYYNPVPVEVNYRGHSGRLFKRDFAGEMLDRFPDLRLLDYGFAYHRDGNFKQDDLTWFLLEKRGSAE